MDKQIAVIKMKQAIERAAALYFALEDWVKKGARMEVTEED